MSMLERKWEKYRDTKLPKNLSEMEILRAKSNFYNGVSAMIDINENLSGMSFRLGVSTLNNVIKELERLI